MTDSSPARPSTDHDPPDEPPVDAKVLAPGAQPPTERDETGFYEPYAGFARVLRTWLVAYGIGAPVLFLSQAAVIEALRAAHVARRVAIVFLLGVAVQVVGALMYKSTMWYLYLGELSKKDQEKWYYKLCEWISVAYWLELSIDISTIVLFGWATWRVMAVLT